MANFNELCLQEHNRSRQKHGCPPLELDKNLCNVAQDWATNIARRNSMQHRPNNSYGENIYWASGQAVNGADPVKCWYAEIKSYKFGRGGFSPSTGHFTQVVWKGSRKLGVGRATTGSSTFVICNYDPPGNISGRFSADVPSKSM